MPDTPPSAPAEPAEARADLTAFTPVPRLKDRSNGWKPEVQRAFIAALAETGSVRAACRRVGRTEHGVYQLRRHPEGEEFRRAWDIALDLGIRRIEDGAMDRALYGTEEQVYYHGRLHATRRKYNERLVMFMLRNRAPHRFAAGGGARGLNAIGKMELERLRKQWRKEWLAEDAEDERETRASIERFLDDMSHNRKANVSPAQREREIAANAQGLADSAAGWRPGEPYRPYADKAAELLPQFIAEVEAEWPPLPAWAWDDEPEQDEEVEGESTPHPRLPAPPGEGAG